MAIHESDVQGRLRALIDPNTGKDFVAGKAVKKIRIEGANVTIDLQLGYPARTQHEADRHQDHCREQREDENPPARA